MSSNREISLDSLEETTSGGGAADIRSSRILIVDDERVILDMLARVLGAAGFTNVRTLSDSSQALAEIRSACPDLLLLDLHMPQPDGFAILDSLEAEGVDRELLSVLILTGDHSLDVKMRAILGFARDLITKPFDPREVVMRVENMARSRLRFRQIIEERTEFADRVAGLKKELHISRAESLETLRAVADRTGRAAAHHNSRVAELAGFLASSLKLPKQTSAAVGRAALLHDIGKAVVDPERPDVHHAIRGAELLRNARSPLLRLAATIARTHHERWDGSGEPAGLKGDAIPLAGRIVAVANQFDLFTNPLSDDAPLSREEALARIKERSGSWYDATVVNALAAVVPMLHSEVAGSYLRNAD
jgi:putative two-component system response regulator